MNNTKKFALNALILTASSLIMSGTSMGFTVYITGKIGAAGMGLYQLIMTVYRLSVTFATGGIGLATTRLVSEEAAVNNFKGALDAVKRCILYALILSVSTQFVLLSASEYIASVWLSDMRTCGAIRLLAFSLPALSVSSVLCGYFTAMRRVVKNSAVLLLEQYIKITLSIYLVSFAVKDGLESACKALVLSGVIAEWVSCITIGIVYLIDIKKHSPKGNMIVITRNNGSIVKRMLGIAVPVALTSYLRSGLSSVEQMMIPWGLKRYGCSENEALAEYGVIGGMVMPVIMFPAVFVSAFSGLLITEISACRAVGAKQKINRIFDYIFGFTMMFSIAVAGILLCFGGDIAMAMYNNSRAARYITLLAPLVCIIYADSVTDSMLKGLNLQTSHMRYNIIDSALSVFLTVCLLPTMGIGGYIVVITVSEGVNFFLSFRKLIKETGFKVKGYQYIIKPAIASLLSVLVVRLAAKGWQGMPIFVSVLLSLAMYVAILFAIGCLSKKDAEFFMARMK